MKEEWSFERYAEGVKDRVKLWKKKGSCEGKRKDLKKGKTLRIKGGCEGRVKLWRIDWKCEGKREVVKDRGKF